MSGPLSEPAGYAELLEQLKAWVRASQVGAARAAHSELLSLCWAVGRDILHRQEQAGWGSRVIERLATDLREELPCPARLVTAQPALPGTSMAAPHVAGAAAVYLTTHGRSRTPHRWRQVRDGMRTHWGTAQIGPCGFRGGVSTEPVLIMGGCKR